MANGDKIKFEQVADEMVGHISGDLIFKIVQAPHELFTRQGDNLHMTMTISLLDSLVGFSRTFPHVDGHNVVVTKPTVSYCSEIVTVKVRAWRVQSLRAFTPIHLMSPLARVLVRVWNRAKACQRRARRTATGATSLSPCK
jgi:hypothetical protein